MNANLNNRHKIEQSTQDCLVLNATYCKIETSKELARNSLVSWNDKKCKSKAMAIKLLKDTIISIKKESKVNG